MWSSSITQVRGVQILDEWGGCWQSQVVANIQVISKFNWAFVFPASFKIRISIIITHAILYDYKYYTNSVFVISVANMISTVRAKFELILRKWSPTTCLSSKRYGVAAIEILLCWIFVYDMCSFLHYFCCSTSQRNCDGEISEPPRPVQRK